MQEKYKEAIEYVELTPLTVVKVAKCLLTLPLENLFRHQDATLSQGIAQLQEVLHRYLFWQEKRKGYINIDCLEHQLQELLSCTLFLLKLLPTHISHKISDILQLPLKGTYNR